MTLTFYERTAGATVEPSAITTMTFPAGEAHVKVDPDAFDPTLDHIAVFNGADSHELVTLAMWADAITLSGGKPILFMPYLPGARQDKGIPYGAKVYADIINSMNAAQVVCVDPHSPKMPGLINNLTILHSDALIKKYINTDGLAGVICPDQGAHERTERVAAALGLPVYYARKTRNQSNGKLSGFECEELPAEGRFLVVDDICDGGGTFMGLADATGLPKERLELWVTHGVFSGKAAQLNDRYSKVYSTTSHPGVTNGKVNVEVFPLLGLMVEALEAKVPA